MFFRKEICYEVLSISILVLIWIYYYQTDNKSAFVRQKLFNLRIISMSKICEREIERIKNIIKVFCLNLLTKAPWSYSMSVITCLWNISDPLLRFIPTLFLYPQVPHSQSTAREHRHLKLHGDWRFLPNFFIFSLH